MKINKIKRLAINTKNFYTPFDEFDLISDDNFEAPYHLQTYDEIFKHRKPHISHKVFYEDCLNFVSFLSNITCIDRHGLKYSRNGTTCYNIICEFGYSTIVFSMTYRFRAKDIFCRMFATPNIMRQFIDYVEQHQDILGDYINIKEHIDVLNVLQNLKEGRN